MASPKGKRKGGYSPGNDLAGATNAPGTGKHRKAGWATAIDKKSRAYDGAENGHVLGTNGVMGLYAHRAADFHAARLNEGMAQVGDTVGNKVLKSRG